MAVDMTATVEFDPEPIALDTREPRFSWIVPSQGRGTKQSAYRIRVSNRHGEVWDSGRVESAQSTHIKYAGAPLVSNSDYEWSVQVWLGSGDTIEIAHARRFSTGFLDPSDWQASWIGMGDPLEPVSDPDMFQPSWIPPEVLAVEPEPRAPMMRTDFEFVRPVRRARAFVCGLGLYELRINGAKAGDATLAQQRTEFRKRCIYSTYDVTDLLRQGANAVGILLGNGWYSCQKKYWDWRMQWYGSPRAIVQIEVEFDDGTRSQVVSDNSWRGSWSPITFNCLFDGEDYDARLEQDGWDAPGFDDSMWQAAGLVRAPGGVLTSATADPDRVTEDLAAVSISEPKPGVYVFDLGRNIAGWARLRVRGAEAGRKITLRFAEALDEHGMLEIASHRPARHEDNYIARGLTDEVYEPRFTYHGFQYVELTGYPGVPPADALTGCLSRTSVARIGQFECASPLINKIHACTVQSQMCNIQMGVPTDDTQRPERIGWGADAWASAGEAMYNLWMPRLYGKHMRDYVDQQTADGLVSMIAPRAGIEEDLVWSSVWFIIPWQQYVYYGDVRILEESYEGLRRYLAYLEETGLKTIGDETTVRPELQLAPWVPASERRTSNAERGYLQKSQIGDHLSTVEYKSRQNLPLSVATAFFYLDVSLFAKISRRLGRDDEANRCDDLAQRIAQAFHERFYNSIRGFYDSGIQSAQAWPLAFNMVPDENRKPVSEQLLRDIAFRKHLTTGYIGTKFAIDVLDELGREDLVWMLANRSEHPGWAHMLSKDRSTTTESWDGEIGSLNHVALGAAIDEWFYASLAGIEADEHGPGFKRIIFHPYMPADLEWARASIWTMRGAVTSSWRQQGDIAWLHVEIPAGSSGVVHVPAESADEVTESGVAAANASCVQLLGASNGRVRFQVGSGEYTFSFPAPTTHC